jgi:hypothetical protein
MAFALPPPPTLVAERNLSPRTACSASPSSVPLKMTSPDAGDTSAMHFHEREQTPIVRSGLQSSLFQRGF